LHFWNKKSRRKCKLRTVLHFIILQVWLYWLTYAFKLLSLYIHWIIQTCSNSANQWWVWVKTFWPGLGQFFVARVGSSRMVWMGLGFKNFPQKSQIFLFFHFGSKKISLGRVKNKLASYLLQVKSMLRLGQGPSLLQTS